MTPALKHTLGAIVLWSAVPIAGIGAWVLSGGGLHAGIVIILCAFPIAALGAWIKKKNCPRCRDNACERR